MPQDKAKINLNLDAFERSARPEPFSIVLGGQPYQLRDVTDVDYRELLDGYRAAQTGNPEPLIRTVVRRQDHDRFFANRLPAYKLQALFVAYNEHYGVDPGEAFGSPAS